MLIQGPCREKYENLTHEQKDKPHEKIQQTLLQGSHLENSIPKAQQKLPSGAKNITTVYSRTNKKNWKAY